MDRKFNIEVPGPSKESVNRTDDFASEKSEYYMRLMLIN